MSQDTERPKVPEFTDGALQLALRHPSDTIKMLAFDLIAKNAEVQASRKLVAELRVVHRNAPDGDHGSDPSWCDHCARYDCPTIRMIDEAGL